MSSDSAGSLDTAGTADLLAVHQSIADMYAAQGRWRHAYEHLRSAVELARNQREPALGNLVEVERLRREHARAREESLTDALTATYNRRYLDRRLLDLRAEHRTAAVALVDLDLFKHVNDAFGHRLGDQVLQRVVALLQQSLPPGAFCARYGGEEFALVLPGIAARPAVVVAERARRRVAGHDWWRLRGGLAVTISIGVATPPDFGTDVLGEADTLLYAAKHAGRNLVAYRGRDGVRVVRTVSDAGLARPRNGDRFASLERG